MPRHPNQSKGAAGYVPRRACHKDGHTSADSQADDVKKLDAMIARKPAKPPHAHRFDGGNKCKVCGLVVESLADGLRAIGYTEGELAEAMALVAEEER